MRGVDRLGSDSGSELGQNSSTGAKSGVDGLESDLEQKGTKSPEVELKRSPTPVNGPATVYALPTKEEAETELSLVRNPRVVESSDPVNYRWENGRFVRQD